MYMYSTFTCKCIHSHTKSNGVVLIYRICFSACRINTPSLMIIHKSAALWEFVCLWMHVHVHVHISLHEFTEQVWLVTHLTRHSDSTPVVHTCSIVEESRSQARGSLWACESCARTTPNSSCLSQPISPPSRWIEQIRAVRMSSRVSSTRNLHREGHKFESQENF